MKLKNTKLNVEDREFFLLLEKATFHNPFAPEREKVLQELTGVSDLVGNKLKELTRSIVQERINKLNLKGEANFNHYKDEDKRLVRIALLYDAFYRFRNKFDLLIQDQIESGDSPITVSFADDMLTLLKNGGSAMKRPFDIWLFSTN